jgi:hypothetical protein
MTDHIHQFRSDVLDVLRWVIYFFMVVVVALCVALLFVSRADAQTLCLEDQGVDTQVATSLLNPAQFVSDDLCINWAVTPGAVNHYHFYADDVNVGNPAQRALRYFVPTKGQVFKLDVEAVGPTRGVVTSALSGSFFVEWVDRDTSQVCEAWAPEQCVDVFDRVVPCP